MKKHLGIILLIFLFLPLRSQEVIKARTNPGYVNITKELAKPPYLEIVPGSLTFSDLDGNQIINANDKAKISFQLNNSGQGPAINLQARISENNSVPGLSYDQAVNIGVLNPGNRVTVEIPISGNLNTTDTRASFSISITEANGFGLDPVVIEVPVRAFINPIVKIVDYHVSSQSGTTIEKRKPFELQVLVQNIGQGNADHVIINLPVPENIYCLTNNTSMVINRLSAGEQKLIEYSFIANNNYTGTDIKFNFQLSEFYNKYAENRNILITMNQYVASEKLVITGKPDESKNIVIGSLTSSVDKNIPFNPIKNPNRIALIIGNEDYSENLDAQDNVAYAINDATVFKQYAVNILSVQENNVYYSLNATAGTMRKNIDIVSKLLTKIGPQAELIFYYAGHGLPDEETKIPYLIPVDVSAENLTAAIKLSDIYDKFTKSGASRITIFIDACFSGGGRNQGLLAARGIRIIPKQESVTGNMIVFSASTEEQSALPFNREKHGLFTFYLLKTLQETSGNITYEQLAESIRKNVSLESLRENGKEQDPVVNVSPLITEQWKMWILK
jgi:hypothetical protein